MQTPKFLQNLKLRFLTTGLTTAGTVGLSGYLATLAQSQTPQTIEQTVITFAAGVFMASAPKLLDVILGVTGNILSNDIYTRFTKQEIYKQIPPEANLYLASYTAFQAILDEVIQTEKANTDKKQIKQFRDITYQDWLELSFARCTKR